MKIQFLGSGSAFVEMSENYQSNILITKEIDEHQYSGSENNTVLLGTDTVTKRLLFDAGGHISESLKSQNLQPTDIDAIVISHAHGDHVHGLEYIGFKTYFIPEFGTNKPILIANNQVIDILWENVLKGTMQHVNGGTLTLDDYFQTTRLQPRGSFQFANTEMNLVQVPHVISDKIEVPSYGMRFEEDGIKIFITGDTQMDYWRFIGFYETYDCIFQECEFAEYPNSVHTQYHELQQLPDNFKKKMFLYHYMLNGKTFAELEEQVLQDGFGGLVARGQEFDTKEMKNA